MRFALEVIVLLLSAGVLAAYPQLAKDYSPKIAKGLLILNGTLTLVAIKEFLVGYVYPLPIRLRHTSTGYRVLPIAGIKLVIGRRSYPTRDAEQRAKGIERVETTVEAKSEFVEVGL
jgi:hypothetical protein